MICAMDNPSGSAPFTIASTMSGARLFKPSTRVTYGGFKSSFAARSVIFFASPLISISIHRCPLRITRSKDCGLKKNGTEKSLRSENLFLLRLERKSHCICKRSWGIWSNRDWRERPVRLTIGQNLKEQPGFWNLT